MALHVIAGWRGLAPEQRGASLALGNCDGVHRGHRQVIADAARAARALGAPLGVLTFEPHPRRWFNPAAQPFRLTTLDQQERLLADLGVDRLYILPFDEALAGLGDEAFAREVLCEGLGARHVAAGFDISFGRGRTGSPETLRAYGERFGFGVSIAEAVSDGSGLKCSSSAVRQALRDGAMRRAAALLGRPYAIEGVVVHGDQLGRTIGFPTANISLEDYVRPAFGIYACRTRLADGREVASVGYVGRRPTVVDGVDERLEVHLFDFDEDLYGQTLEVDLTDLVRGDRKFATLDEMVAQMALDAARARELLIPAF
jgi:riboflavin kinase / FMN adenylyltransferase